MPKRKKDPAQLRNKSIAIKCTEAERLEILEAIERSEMTQVDWVLHVARQGGAREGGGRQGGARQGGARSVESRLTRLEDQLEAMRELQERVAALEAAAGPSSSASKVDPPSGDGEDDEEASNDAAGANGPAEDGSAPDGRSGRGQQKRRKKGRHS